MSGIATIRRRIIKKSKWFPLLSNCSRLHRTPRFDQSQGCRRSRFLSYRTGPLQQCLGRHKLPSGSPSFPAKEFRQSLPFIHYLPFQSSPVQAQYRDRERDRHHPLRVPRIVQLSFSRSITVRGCGACAWFLLLTSGLVSFLSSVVDSHTDNDIEKYGYEWSINYYYNSS